MLGTSAPCLFGHDLEGDSGQRADGDALAIRLRLAFLACIRGVSIGVNDQVAFEAGLDFGGVALEDEFGALE